VRASGVIQRARNTWRKGHVGKERVQKRERRKTRGSSSPCQLARSRWKAEEPKVMKKKGNQH